MLPSHTLNFGRKGFWAISLTVFMVAYNVNVLPAVMPAIVHDFNTSVGLIQSVLVLFSLVTASFAPTTENLCRFYGRTPIFLTALVLYGIGIALTAMSPSIGIMAISFSLLTGLAAAPLVSMPWTIADLAFKGESAERATLMLVVMSAAGGLTGVLLGGYVAFLVGWRWAFAPSIILLIAVWLLKRSLPNLIVRSEQSIDWIGGLLSFLGLGSILAGISLANEFGWWEPKRLFEVNGVVLPPFAISIVPTLIAAGVIILGLFIFWQRRQANQNKASLLRVGLLRKSGFVLGMLTAMMHTLITTGLQFNLYQFVPLALTLNPFRTSLTIIPYNLTMIIVIALALKFLALGDRLPPKSIVLSGIAFLALGTVILYFSLHLQVTPLRMLPGLIVMGMGSGLFLSYIGKLTYAVASEAEKPEGSGIYNPIQNLGSSLGRSILGTTLFSFASQRVVDSIFQELGQTLNADERSQLTIQLQDKLQTLSMSEVGTILVDKLPSSVAPLLQPIGLEAITYGMRNSLLTALGFMGIGFLLAITLSNRPSKLS